MKEILTEHKDNISKIFKLAAVDFTKSYRGAVLGWAWAIIKPVITIFVYWFTIEIGLRSGKDRSGYPSFLWIIASTISWFYIGSMITAGASSLRSYNYLVTKMKFPISIIHTIVNLSHFFLHVVLITIVIIIFRAWGYQLDFYILQVGIYMILSFIFLNIWSLLASTLSALSKDFLNLVKSINVFVFWMSGIFWEIDKISNVWARKILWLNPVAFLINGYRNCFINKVFIWEEPKKFFVFCGVLIILSILSFFVYKKYKKDIPDVL